MAKRIFDIDGYPTDPHAMSTKHLWFYVQKDGVIVAHANGSAAISWAQIRRALADHGKAKSRRPGPMK